MSPRHLAAGLLAGLLCITSISRAVAPLEKCSESLVSRVYSVADLVVPLDRAPATPQTKTNEAQLIQLITSTVQPQSWSQAGGSGVAEYFPLNMALVVRQTEPVHTEVAELLTSLRRLLDVQVAVQVRFMTISPRLLEVLALEHKEGKLLPVTMLEDAQVKKLLEMAQGDRRTNIMQAPKLTMFNGQRSGIEVADNTGIQRVGVDFEDREGDRVPPSPHPTPVPGTRVRLHPTVAPDLQNLTLQVEIEVTRMDIANVSRMPGVSGEEVSISELPTVPRLHTLAIDKTLKMKSGMTVMLSGWTVEPDVSPDRGPPILSKVPYVNRLFRNSQQKPEPEHTLVLVTPRIVVPPEEERPTSPQPGDPVVQEARPDPAPASRQKNVTVTAIVPAESEPTEVLHVRSRSFHLMYDIENIGRSKVRGIDVWWTREDRRFSRHSDEVKSEGPIPIQVEAEGRYGFTLVARSGVGLAVEPPRQGNEPQVWIEVDQTAPKVEVYPVKVSGTPGQPAKVEISWSAIDRNLGTHPVTILHAEHTEGPWKTLATEQPASGLHVIDTTQLPYSFHIRVEARDRAGNVGSATAAEPIKVDPEIPIIRRVKVHLGR